MSNIPKNAVTWFSIPASDYEKSIVFYEALLETQLRREVMGEGDMAMSFAVFPNEGPEHVTGAVTAATSIPPASGGVVIYLACSDLDGSVGRTAKLGGKVLQEPMPLPEDMGRIAVIADLDGNPIGLHQA
ncbi:MAG: VOC family protein [Cohaesibacter sp.]|jgi:predicted enzyme related to lactoylglutathione lyase|nr:VOC family protein [Cohaesibacter sp.]